jgi:superfamily II DNA or RNA helicase
LFHSQLKDKEKDAALSQFVDPNYPQNLLCSTRALSEGFNVSGINLAVIFAFSSKANTLIQRVARTLRYIEGKQAIIFMLVVKDTQEEQWARNALKDLPNVRYFDSWNTFKSLL